MEHPRQIRGLRIAWSVVFGVLCVLLIVLWVRRYWWLDAAYGPSSPPKYFVVTSILGRLYWDESTFLDPVSSRFGKNSIRVRDSGFSATELLNSYVASEDDSIPYWVLVAVLGTFATAPWILRRFSLRSLLIGTTVIAVVLGLVVWAYR